MIIPRSSALDRMDARMLKVVAVMQVSAAVTFVEFTQRDDFPGKFSWDT